MTHQKTPIVPNNFGNTSKALPEHTRRLSASLNNLADGWMNVSGSVTLSTSGTTTTVYAHNAGPDTVPLLMPLNAAAATALSSIYVSSRQLRSFQLTHDESSATRSFAYVVIG